MGYLLIPHAADDAYIAAAVCFAHDRFEGQGGFLLKNVPVRRHAAAVTAPAVRAASEQPQAARPAVSAVAQPAQPRITVRVEPATVALSGAYVELHKLAASGPGFSRLASRHYGTPDYQLVRMAWHEAGHAVMARLHGQAAEIHMTARGGCLCWHADQTLEATRLIAIAGGVSEAMAEHDVSDAWLETHCRDRMSDQDLRLAGAFTLADVKSAAKLVRANWSEFARVAQFVQTECAKHWAR